MLNISDTIDLSSKNESAFLFGLKTLLSPNVIELQNVILLSSFNM